MKKNFKKTAENVHKLKHKISILGLEKAHREATFFEDDLRYHQNTERHRIFALTLKSMSDFCKRYSSVNNFLNKYHMNCIIVDDDSTAKLIVAELCSSMKILTY